MSESGDYVPAPEWKGTDFKSARAAYDTVIKDSFKSAVAAGVDVSDCVPPEIETDAEAAICIGFDVTGSMGEWAGKIRGHLGYVDHEMREYFGQDTKVSFFAIGDVFCDRYPLQAKGFVNGIEMQKNCDAMIIEGGGGGNGGESYDIAALYYARHCHMPNVIHKPVMIFIGDEAIYSFVDKSAAKTWARCDEAKRLTPKTVFDELKGKFSVYIIRKPYGNSTVDHQSAEDKRIHEQWVDFLGADHVTILPTPDRVVDVIFGIFAAEMDRVEYYEEELVERQSKDKDGPEKIEIALKAVKTLHTKKTSSPAKSGKSGNSISKGSGGPANISLAEEDDE